MKIRFWIIISAAVLLFSGCVRKDVAQAAAECFASGQYETAEDYFILALSEKPDDTALKIGHGYNLMMLGESQEAVNELYPLFIDLYNRDDNGADITNSAAALIDIFIDNEMYNDADDVLDKLARRIPDCMKDEVRQLQRAKIREGRYRDDPESVDLWIEAMEDILSLKAYAPEDYLKLLSVVSECKTDEEYLELVDRYLVYMNGHSAFIEDYAEVTDVIFDAANRVSYSTYVKDSEDYYVQAEAFLQMAESHGMDEQTLMRYRISIAERRGRTDTALKLLGVYLTHYPDDTAALKEKSYLENRLGE